MTTVKDILVQLESLGDETRRKHNARVGPDGIAGAPLDKQFGVKTGDIRALAKKIKPNHQLALELWKTGNMDAQLLAILLMKPKELTAKDLDAMVREGRFPWVADWLQSYIIKAQPPAEKEKLRQKWMKSKDPWAARAGWHLTAAAINQGADEGDLEVPGLLERIEKQMPKALPETQWTMNSTLGAIGIHHEKHRQRALALGEQIGLYRGWPVSRGCTPPYVPTWVEAMVKRQG